MTWQRQFSSMMFLATILFLSSVIITNADTRTALVIGNSNYRSTPLVNPVNDATDMAATLKSLGFDVIVNTNANKLEMLKALEAFKLKLRISDAGLFYYAGHGMHIRGSNYLIPVDVQINSELEVEYESVNAGRVLATMENSGCKVNVIILDACRNNPFRRKFRSAERGLAIMDAPTGSILAYSTAPGAVAIDGTGRNGLYTSKILKYLPAKGIKIEDLFKKVRIEVMAESGNKQVPWESSSLIENFYFFPTNKAERFSIDALPSRSAEFLYWESIKDTKDIDKLLEYLKIYPNGIFSELATLEIYKYSEKKTLLNTNLNSLSLLIVDKRKNKKVTGTYGELIRKEPKTIIEPAIEKKLNDLDYNIDINAPIEYHVEIEKAYLEYSIGAGMPMIALVELNVKIRTVDKQLIYKKEYSTSYSEVVSTNPKRSEAVKIFNKCINQLVNKMSKDEILISAISNTKNR